MKKIIIALIGFALLASCDDFLVESPKTEIAVDQFFTNADDARGVVNSVYRIGAGAAYYGSGGFGGSDAMMGSYMSGLFDNEGKGERIQGQLAHDLQVDPVNLSQFLGGWWNGMYLAISRANLAITGIENVPQISDSERATLTAEARYFRALNYFFLVKNFGDVPLVLEPTDGLEGIFVERTPSDVVYNQIVEDLEWALNNGQLPDVPFSGGNEGRVTRGAVAALLADVNLQRAGFPVQNTSAYAAAASAARTVINSGTYSLIQHGDNIDGDSAYNRMRSDDSPEYIWSIEYDAGVSDSGYPRITIPGVVRPEGIAYGRTLNMYRPINEIIQLYDPEMDLRVQNRQMYYTSLERDGVVYEFNEYVPYIWYEEQAVFETARGDRNLNITRYSEVLLIAAEAIARTEGVTAEAVGYLADVRSRAYWQTDRQQIVDALSGLSADQFVEEVWKERYRELALDFKAWPDIQRTRQYPTTTEVNPGDATFVNVIGADNNWGQTYQEYHLLFPIPDEEMQRNENLVQNPGY